jgi:hypothetical protein
MGFFSKAIGGLLGGGSEDVASAANQGFDYLQDNKNVKLAQKQGRQAQGLLAGLLGLGGDQAAAEQAFGQYQDSTGFQFRMDRGMGAIEGSRAARGVLNSGATSKELMKFGQGLASEEFGNYLSQLSGMADTGLQSAFQVGGAGGAAGGAVAAATRQGQEDAVGTAGGLARLGMGVATGGLSSIFGF